MSRDLGEPGTTLLKPHPLRQWAGPTDVAGTVHQGVHETTHSSRGGDGVPAELSDSVQGGCERNTKSADQHPNMQLH